MTVNIKAYINELREIRTYLIKLGPSRRKGQILTKKLEEIRNINEQYLLLVADIGDKIKRGLVTSEDLQIIDEDNRKYKSLYAEIEILCKEVLTMSGSEEFNLKTALSLLPLMNDEEKVTQQLIDNIEYYNTLLEKNECKINLINFVLKSRLSQSAKLKLDEKYLKIDDLLKDMRCKLLAQKAATAIQAKLQTKRQTNETISEFGSELAQLFVDLTISQSNGDTNSYKVLRPLNEKVAIKKFADGLRNRRISTIIAARNFDTLKDAIQAAVDEEITLPSSAEVIGTYTKSNKPFNYHGFSSGYNQTRGNFRGNYNQRYNNFRGGFRRPSRGGYGNRTYQNNGTKYFNYHYNQRGGQGVRFNRGNNNKYQNTRNYYTKNMRNKQEKVNVMSQEEENFNLNELFRDQ
jgi:hypothetical protein